MKSPSPAPYAAGRSQMEIRRVGAYLGAEISGIDLSQPLSTEQRTALYDALLEHEVIVFRDQAVTTQQLVAFGRQFGRLSVHPFSPNRADIPELIILDNDKDNPPLSTDVWHSDETFRRAPPLGTILRARIVPAVGGDTLFASMTAAYAGLGAKYQQLIDDLQARHDFVPFRKLFGADPNSRGKLREMEDEFPNPLHPVVSVHPETGRRALFVNPQFTLSVDGLNDLESRTLLNFLYQQAHIPEYQCRITWQPDTVVFWDNRSTQHYAAHDYYSHRRLMERVTLCGTRPRGIDSAAPSAAIAAKFGPKVVNAMGYGFAANDSNRSVKRQYRRSEDTSG